MMGSLVSIIHRRGVVVFFNAQVKQALLTQFCYISGARGHMQHPLVEPLLESFERARALMILTIIIMVALIVTLDGRRMRAPRLMHNGSHLERWRQHAIRVAQDHLARNDLFGNEYDIPRCQSRLLAYAEIAPEMGVAILVAALYVDNGDIGMQRGNEQQRRTIPGGCLLAKGGVLARDVTAQD